MRRFFYRFDFQKLNKAGYLSHRELIMALGRLLRSAGLPLHTSQGHLWPSLKLSVLSPLPVGIESLREIATFGLKEFLYPSGLLQRFKNNILPGLSIMDVVPLSGNRKLDIARMSFEITFDEELSFDSSEVDHWLNQERETSSGEDNRQENITRLQEGLQNLNVNSNSLEYSTVPSKQILHPGKLLEEMQAKDGFSLPMVKRILKTEMILKENKHVKQQ